MDFLKTTMAGAILVPVIWLTFILTSGVILPLMILFGLASCLSLVLFSRQRRLDRVMRSQCLNPGHHHPERLNQPYPRILKQPSVPLDGPTARRRSG